MKTTTRTHTIRRFAVAAAMATVPVLALGFSPVAGAKTSPPFSSCDNHKSSTIWDGVTPAKYSPTNTGTGNRDIQWPNGDSTRGWAVHEGQYKPAVDTDLLVVPTVRESGIECANLLGPDAPEYFKHAYDEIGQLPKGTDWALMINSADDRGQEQMHIHLTRLAGFARADIDKAAKGITTDEHQWLNSEVSLHGRDVHGKQSELRGYRAWATGSMNHNFFAKLNDDIVQPLKKQGNKDAAMAHETMLITANHDPKGPAFIVISSDKNSGLKPFGVDNLERLLDKGGKPK